ncbi:SDR family NAD(P)-dependent oxidoreductase [Candidimonas sp. SYP-B2681]|uniref:SDR family NAD(P)-dependent oxidoreductase n=1 Tax=Candidimonas sp. SYP-B2681 TaxID=2497686 RepID=UPI000F88D3E3|nr:SDR family NAD(P)-dependent oxidoreductase [Candidimonas sp. SYP-B2681]RTZ43185.1 SDR family NAD(P)-dependent oxidoreductase [Candidimonas sp. SYP-B2681]
MQNRKRKIVIIGATSAIAEHCARLWIANASIELILVGRNAERTERVATDLRVRGLQSTVLAVVADFVNPAAIQEFADSIVATGPVDCVLIAHGSLPDQAECQTNLDACSTALSVNGVSPVLFAEAFASHMQKINQGTVAIIGSVAGDRGRKSNYVYGAAKGLVTRYAQGLQHRLAGTNVKVVLIKPGPTDTPMTASMKGSGAKLASVESVASDIVRGIEQGRPVVYTPRKWELIMMVIRHLPRFVFNKMDI